MPISVAGCNGTAQSSQTTPSELSTDSDRGHQRIQREIPPNPGSKRCPPDHFSDGSIFVCTAMVRSRRPSNFMPLISIVSVPVIWVVSESEKMMPCLRSIRISPVPFAILSLLAVIFVGLHSGGSWVRPTSSDRDVMRCSMCGPCLTVPV